VDYSHLNIMAMPSAPRASKPTRTRRRSPMSTPKQLRLRAKVKMKVPIFNRRFGQHRHRPQEWRHFAVGAAISGSPSCAENVWRIDPARADGRAGSLNLPKWTAACGIPAIMKLGRHSVQMKVEDTRLGVAEYVIDKLAPKPSN